MSRDLTNLFIDETFQYLTQISGSNQDILLDGVGNRITELQVTASHATSASYASTASLLQGNAEQVETIDFQIGGTPALQRLSWNDTAGTLDLGLKGGNVTLQIGQEEVTRVVNKTGTNLLEAQYRVVKVLGAQGQRLSVAFAQANSDLNSASTLGLVTENINVNQEGFITTLGLVRGINTTGTLQGETWNDGDVLYLSGVTPGVITNVKPQSPTHLVTLGYVVYAHQTQGSIYVKVDNGYELEELHDVLITSASNGQALVYDNGIWINSDIQHISSSYAVSSSQAENANTATSASYALTASYALNAGGGGFPYTGSADISGSLNVVGPINSETFGTISLTGDSPGINRNILDFTGADFSVIRSDSGMVIDNTAGTGSISVFTNGNMQYEPQGDLDFYTPTGRVNLTGNKVKITDNSTTPFDCTQINTRYFSVNLAETGSGFGGMRIGTNDQFLNMGVGGYDGGGGWVTTTQMNFGGSQQAFFSADTDFYIKNNDGSNGQVVVWADGTTIVRAGTSVEIQGGNFPGEEVPINIKGDAFLYSATTNINGFTYQVDNQTTVRDNQRAFVETPLVITNLGSVSVGLNSVLKVINEL